MTISFYRYVSISFIAATSIPFLLRRAAPVPHAATPSLSVSPNHPLTVCPQSNIIMGPGLRPISSPDTTRASPPALLGPDCSAAFARYVFTHARSYSIPAIFCPFSSRSVFTHRTTSLRCTDSPHFFGANYNTAIARYVSNHGRSFPITAVVCTSCHHLINRLPPSPYHNTSLRCINSFICSASFLRWRPAAPPPPCSQKTSICKPSRTLTVPLPRLRLCHSTPN